MKRIVTFMMKKIYKFIYDMSILGLERCRRVVHELPGEEIQFSLNNLSHLRDGFS